MSVNLVKGQRLDLTKGNANLSNLLIGLGWDVNQFDTSSDFDLDASAFLVKENGKVGSEADFIFYGNMEHSSGCIKHTGDNRTGVGEGDDEQILVDLTKIPAGYNKIAITVTIYDAINRMQNFGLVNNAYIRVVDETTNTELLRYDLTENYSTETALVVAEIYQHSGSWKFNAVGSGYTGGLASLCNQYGVDAING